MCFSGFPGCCWWTPPYARRLPALRFSESISIEEEEKRKEGRWRAEGVDLVRYPIMVGTN
jgi:hypothetical protein